jgi:hypothetical protein
MTSASIDHADSRVILLGTSLYDDKEFPDVPAAGKSLHGMRLALTDPRLGGWPTDRVEYWLNKANPQEVTLPLRELARSVTGVLIFYFVGHGTINSRGELCLILKGTGHEHPDVTGVEYERIRRALLDSPARTKIAILDCCYSGRAIGSLSAGSVPEITRTEGAYTLTASNMREEIARWSGAGRKNDPPTAFTRELLDLMYEGIPGGPAVLTLNDLYVPLQKRLLRQGLPKPNSLGTDTADRVPFTRNSARANDGEPPTAVPLPTIRHRPEAGTLLRAPAERTSRQVARLRRAIMRRVRDHVPIPAVGEAFRRAGRPSAGTAPQLRRAVLAALAALALAAAGIAGYNLHSGTSPKAAAVTSSAATTVGGLVLSANSGTDTWAGDQTNLVALAWTPLKAPLGAVTGYSVRRNGVLIATLPGAQTTYRDEDLPDGGTFTYQVTAADALAGTAPTSNAVSLVYLPPGQSGMAWLGSPASSQVSYCRRVGVDSSAATHQVICTFFDGANWTSPASAAGIDWGSQTGRAWVLYHRQPAFCRRSGSGTSPSGHRLLCTLYKGKTWATYASPPGIDWGPDVGWTWLTTSAGIDYCRRTGVGGSLTRQSLSCTVFDGQRWSTYTSQPGIDWGIDSGANWVTLNGHPAYCRVTSAKSAASQALSCTTLTSSGTWTTANSSPGIDAGDTVGHGWVTTEATAAYCRRIGPGAPASAHRLACTVFDGRRWSTYTSQPGIDWGIDSGANWVTLNGGPSYCRPVDTKTVGSQALSCTTLNGSGPWTTVTAKPAIGGGYPAGRAWVTTSIGIAQCGRGGTGGNTNTEYLQCAAFDGKNWVQAPFSPANLDWGYAT